MLKLIELTRGRVLDVSPEAVIAEVSGTEAEVDNFVALRPRSSGSRSWSGLGPS